MAKRYHGAKKGMGQAMGPMHHTENRMIGDDKSAPCMLPRMVMEKEYGHYPESPIGSGIPDLYSGVQKQMKEDISDARREFRPKKY